MATSSRGLLDQFIVDQDLLETFLKVWYSETVPLFSLFERRKDSVVLREGMNYILEYGSP